MRTLVMALGIVASKRRAAMKERLKGTAITRTGFDGDGETLTIFVAVAPDGSIRAIWLMAEAAE
jgi:hypothetical protein